MTMSSRDILPTDTLLWVSENWRLRARKLIATYYFLDNKVTGFCDYPILYTDGTIAYDFPEHIPQYVKRACYQAIKAHKQYA